MTLCGIDTPKLMLVRLCRYSSPGITPSQLLSAANMPISLQALDVLGYRNQITGKSHKVPSTADSSII